MKNLGEGCRSVLHRLYPVSRNASLPIGVHFRRHMCHAAPPSPVPSFDCAYFPSPQGCTRPCCLQRFLGTLCASVAVHPLPITRVGGGKGAQAEAVGGEDGGDDGEHR